MRNLNKILLLLVLFTGAFLKTAHSQVYRGQEAAQIVYGADVVKISTLRNTADFVKLQPSHQIDESKHYNWLLAEVLKVPSSNSLQLQKEETDYLGYRHFRYQQYYHGVPVQFGTYTTHCRNGKLESANGEYYDKISISVTAALSKSIAFAKALAHIHAIKYKDDNSTGLTATRDKGELVIFPKANNYFLAYKFDIYAEQPLKRAYVYVDANTGNILFEEDRICHGDAIGTAVTGFSGTKTITTDSLSPTSFRLRETGRGNGINTKNLNNGTSYGSATDFTDSDNLWNSVTLDQYAYDAHYGAEKTYDFYFNNFGRDSYDNAGAVINSYVHYGSNFVNAFWDGIQMTYGDGDGVDYYPLTSMEIVGHEITHAVTENTAGLVYANESGALNESFSDIFGNTIRFISNPGTATWFVGDEILRPGGSGTPFRNMSNPNQFDCADTYNGTFWNNGDIVHYDSGVQNFWYYLLSTGGTGVNDIGSSYSVIGIGLTDAAAIAFRNLAVYLSPNSTFADARFFAIQSAVDLFGNCSNQVIQTTNAWYAVGVGGVFSNAVVANFSSANNFFCTLPANVAFINNSINATSYAWDFGDGGASTLATPTHTYASAGTYTVTLISNGIAACGNADTLIQINYITVTNGGGPVTNACSPSTVSFCCDAGITNFQFGTINKTSVNASEGYKDFTCGTATTVTAGNPVPISVTTSSSTFENVRAYIDYDNNGSFDPATELVFTSLNKRPTHTGVVNTPVSAVLNMPLRMRVMDDNVSAATFGPCTNLSDGQAEDYTITFIANTQPPIADFTANVTVVNVGGSINFSDLTQNAPTSWSWTFTGGTPSTSSLQNPTVTYNTLGTYTVSLTVTNSFGTDTETKTAYINVVNSINMCTGISTTVAPNGQLYDSGGPSGSYQNSENCSLLIDPSCALSVTLTFSQFNSESGYDYLRVYNGPNAASPLILTANGSSLPATVTANSGTMFITWSSDGSVISTGWAAAWTSVVGSGNPPVAGFTTSGNNPPFATPVQFTDQTTNTPIAWSWDFGDGQTSVLQNPLHTYLSSGSKTIRLIATNCIASDTITQTVNVQTLPQISTNPDSISVSLNCSDSITIPVTIYNTGTGDLVYNINSTGNGNVIDTAVLVIQENSAWGLSMLSYLQTNFGVTPTVITSSQIAATDFSLYDIVVTTGNQSTAYYGAISANKAKFETFVNSGGIVQYQLAQMSGSGTTLLAGGASMSYGNLQNTNTGLIPAHPILFGLTNPLNGNSANHCTLSNIPAGAQIITETAPGSFPTTVEYGIGNGYVVATGMTWEYLFLSTYNSGPMLTNSFNYHFSNLGGGSSGWITTTAVTDTVAPGDSSIIYVTISTAGLNAGTYNGQLIINSNDTTNSPLIIPVHLVVSGPAAIALSDTCINFGQITQFTTAFDTLTIGNSGCDTLRITSTSLSNGAFAVMPSVFNVAPGADTNIVISFNPQTVGTFSGTLTLFNNVNDTVICLNGSSVIAPQIAFNPASLSASLNACGDSITLPLYVLNTGGNTLNFNVSGSGAIAQVKVLAMLYGVDLTTEYPTLINGINQYFTNYTLDTTFTITPSVLQTRLTNMDVLLLPEQETGININNSQFASVIQNFVANGGTVIVCGSQYSDSENRIYGFGLFTGSYAGFNNGGTSMVVSDTTDDLMDGIPLSFASANATFYHSITNVDKVELVSLAGNDVVTYREIGSGKAIYLGFDYFLSSNQTNRIAANAIRYANSSSLPPWVSTSPDLGSVNGGDSVLINVTFNSAGYAGGVYTGYILFYSNDPLHPVDSVAVTMTVANNPCANFNFTPPAGCSGIVSFRDTTLNNPTSWQWNFGDGGTSALQNPFHSYTAPGTYNVQLIACNATACDTIIKSITITSVSGPQNASCTPVTTANCCGMGITHVVFGTINKTSPDGLEGYKDFTCSNLTNVISGSVYSLAITTGITYAENVRAWIDYNNNGIFDVPSEQVFASTNVLTTHTGNVTISATAVLNTPLRMRISSDYFSNAAPAPCTNLQYGQAEDYTVIIQSNTIPPVAIFTATVINTCTGYVQFNDLSQNAPTSWAWAFGDGATSSVQSPTHYYANAGTYNAQLISTNAFGSDTAIQSVTVNVLNGNFSVSGLLQVGQNLQFTPVTTTATTYNWNFGDGYLANVQSPTHAYSATGTYIVALTITSGPCTVIAYDTLVILTVGINEINGLQSLTISPNPFKDEITIAYELTANNTISIEAVDMLGQSLTKIAAHQKQAAGKYSYRFKPESAGIYYIKFVIDNQIKVVRVTKIN